MPGASTDDPSHPVATGLTSTPILSAGIIPRGELQYALTANTLSLKDRIR